MIARRNPNSSYLTDHAQACEQIGYLSAIAARMVACTSPELRNDPVTRIELGVLAGQAAQLDSVQSAAARLAGCSCGCGLGNGIIGCSCGCL